MAEKESKSVEVAEVASTVSFTVGDKAKHLEKGTVLTLSVEDAKHLESKGYGKITK